jgi:hypothetical protein
MSHPEPKETTVFFSEVGVCPDLDCDGQLKFDPLANYDGAFAVENNVLVATMKCEKCGYTTTHHFMLRPDDQPPQETEDHPERDRAYEYPHVCFILCIPGKITSEERGNHMPDGSWDIDEFKPYKMTLVGSCWIELSPVHVDVLCDFMVLYPFAKTWLMENLAKAKKN